MAAVEHWHVVSLCHCIDSIHQWEEVALYIDILFTMSREEDILVWLEVEILQHVWSLNMWHYLRENFCHRRSYNISVLWPNTWFEDISASMLGIAHIDIGCNVNNSTYYLFRKVLVLATVTSLHVEDRNFKTLCCNNAQARVSVAKNDHRIRLYLNHEVVSLGNDVTHCLTNVLTYYPEVVIRLPKTEILKEYLVEVVIIVLTCVNQHMVEIFIWLLDDSTHLDNLRTSTDNSH